MSRNLPACIIKVKRCMKPRIPGVLQRAFVQITRNISNEPSVANVAHAYLHTIIRFYLPPSLESLTLKLPTTISILVRERVFEDTIGSLKQDCEDNICKHCILKIYYKEDKSLSKAKIKSVGSITNLLGSV